MSLGTLTKWTAPAFFYLTVVPLLAWRGELRMLFGWRHLLACGVAVAVCAAWVFAVSLQIGWESLFETLRGEVAYRFAPKSAARGYPWGELVTYPILVLAAHLPVSLFALLTLRRGFAARFDDRGKLLLQLLHRWTWPNSIFWTLVPNHNVRYILPMSRGADGSGRDGLGGTLRDIPRVRQGVVAFLSAGFLAKVAFVEFVVLAHRRIATRSRPRIFLRELVPPTSHFISSA